ncbi:hypothetical protein H6F44_20405 [Pseudanabaena sp. FACHB-1277]|uniref:PLD phosphodiesterase domain-containing protein n=1 Tax=Pseudanabaena cinerea FACHB-1277 TaxID=2949581 RepID=A0A926UX32_9CYAN|nr:phospholipase D-like domain-containing protein [Pseudanabaena cinerea]MBD2152461.1 hypothetical protein [Pseudanabaena cinerea FACHB-1277]
MKIIWKVTGYYEWIPQDGNSNLAAQNSSLADLLTDLQAIATQQKQYQIATIHQSFGLSFLPKHTLTHLLQYNSARSPLRLPLMNERTLCPLLQNPTNSDFDSNVQRFSCQFTTTQLPQNFRLPLSFDDPQIPVRNTGDRAIDTYRITIENPTNQRLQTIKNEAIQELKQFIQTRHLDFLHIALKTLSSDFSISLPLSNNCTALVQLRELPTDLQQAIKYLQKPQPQEFTEQAQSLVRAYRARYSQTIPNSHEIPNLSFANSSEKTEFAIGRKISREVIENLITNAKKFLMICSYRIEDLEIAEMLARKAQKIPIWILTEFNDNVQNRVDANMVGRVEIDPEYANSDRQKRECLLILRDAGLIFRGGNFHIKSYISENSAYLGSCNLTGGSLGRNGEAGTIWHSTSEHQFLIDYFRHLWKNETDAETMPLANALELRVTSRRRTNTPLPISDRFLNHQEYIRDVTNFFQNFAGEEVRIYTRNLNPPPQQINLLRSSNNRIYFGSYNNAGLPARKIENLHAKIVIIGSQVAYIGSQDLAISRDPFLNLTYKTTNPQEIAQINQQLRNLH